MIYQTYILDLPKLPPPFTESFFIYLTQNIMYFPNFVLLNFKKTVLFPQLYICFRTYIVTYLLIPLLRRILMISRNFYVYRINQFLFLPVSNDRITVLYSEIPYSYNYIVKYMEVLNSVKILHLGNSI